MRIYYYGAWGWSSLRKFFFRSLLHVCTHIPIRDSFGDNLFANLQTIGFELEKLSNFFHNNTLMKLSNRKEKKEKMKLDNQKQSTPKWQIEVDAKFSHLGLDLCLSSKSNC